MILDKVHKRGDIELFATQILRSEIWPFFFNFIM